MDRTILHCDCNSFFASVELLKRPELRQDPVAVCGDPARRKGVVLAKNEPAKACGVTTGEPVFAAMRKCPNLVLLPPHHDLYVEYSRKINNIYEQYTNQVEPFGIDESWLDVTESIHLFGDGKTIADQLREKIRRELGLTISVGVSFNKIFAKMGSDYQKPDATTIISKDNYQELLYHLPVKALLFVGRSAAERLARIGIRTIGDLAAVDVTVLEEMLGKSGEMLYKYANGLDNSPVSKITDHKESKSIGKGLTFSHDLHSLEEVRTQVLWLTDTVAAQLRSANLKCLSVQVTIRDPSFKNITRQHQLASPSALTRTIYETAVEIINSNWSFKKPIRMLTITAQHLIQSDEQRTQISLFNEEKETEKREKLETSIDDLRRRFGRSAVTFGRLVGEQEEDEKE